jgi:hypothetical protein
MGDGLFGLLGFLNQLLYEAYHEMANTQRETAFFPEKLGRSSKVRFGCAASWQ